MSVAFYPGQTLDQNDLNIIIRDDTGTPVDPFYIRYSLFDNTTGLPVLIGPANRVPATTGVGQYYANATLPLDSNIGDWMIHWNFRETSGSPMVQVVQEFNIVDQQVRITISDNNSMNDMIRRVRVLLRDNNPDRNYSVSGREKVKIRAGNKDYSIRIEDLYNIIEEGNNGNL